MIEQAQAQFTRHDLEAKIVKRSWEDEAFRKEFTSDPAGAFTKYLDVPAGHLPKITISQEEPGTWHIVLPTKPGDASELSDTDLEKVAGGTAVPPTLIVSAITILVGSAAVSGGVTVSATVISQKEGGW
jgi:hypothetical protein